MKLGLFTVMTPSLSPDECITQCADLGYDGIEWRINDNETDHRCEFSSTELHESGSDWVAKCAAAGLACPSVATYVHSDDMAGVERHLKAAAAAGIQVARIGPGRFHSDKTTWPEGFAEAKARYRTVAELAARHGVRAVIETHHGQWGNTVMAARQLLDGLDPAHVGIMWDPANQIIEGKERYEAAIQGAGEYLAEVHAKNCWWIQKADERSDAQIWEPQWCPLKQGLVNWPEVIRCLHQHGYDQWIIFEDFSLQNPLDQRLRENISWFRSLLASA